ncbi:MAG: DUF3052 domain-containing protein [Pseudomonadota bacterium]
MPAAAGYSGKPLAAKLGIAEGVAVLAINAPPEYAAWLAPLPHGARIVTRPVKDQDFVHLFATERSALARALCAQRDGLPADAVLWVSWPKKASKQPTDITEDTVRELALPLGWVDVKVCAVSEVWSGLKLVVRKALR